jgi:hypothetical protein
LALLGRKGMLAQQALLALLGLLVQQVLPVLLAHKVPLVLREPQLRLWGLSPMPRRYRQVLAQAIRARGISPMTMGISTSGLVAPGQMSV